MAGQNAQQVFTLEELLALPPEKPKPLTLAEVEELECLDAAADPPTWKAVLDLGGGNLGYTAADGIQFGGEQDFGGFTATGIESTTGDPVATIRLIAAARNALPGLLRMARESFERKPAGGEPMRPELKPTVLIDSREQTPWQIEGFPVEVVGLPCGDYGLRNFSTWENPGFIVERKSLSDLVGSLTGGRERFLKEIEKLRAFRFKALVIEAMLGPAWAARLGEAWHGKGSIFTAFHLTRRGKAGRGRARLGAAWHGKGSIFTAFHLTRLGKAGRGSARQGWARPGTARLGEAWHGKGSTLNNERGKQHGRDSKRD